MVNALLVFEWIAFLVSIVFFKQLKKQGLLFIPVLLLVIVFSEGVGKLNQMYRFMKSVEWFNVMIPVQFLCLFALFHRNTKYSYWRITIRVFAACVVVLTIINLFTPGPATFNVLNYTIGTIFICACCLHYLYECMNSRSIVTVHKNILFYLALGTLLCYLGTLPLHSMRNYLYYNYRNIFFTYNTVSYVLNMLMYGLITFGILWAQKK
jgi:hypothetical protein